MLDSFAESSLSSGDCFPSVQYDSSNSLGERELTGLSENQFQIESLVMGAEAQGLEESSPRAISLLQIVVALNMVTKVCFTFAPKEEMINRTSCILWGSIRSHVWYFFSCSGIFSNLVLIYSCVNF